MNIKASELPKGTIIELPNGNQFELTSDWKDRDPHDVMSKDFTENVTDFKIISMPYEVIYQLATWLDNVYTKTGTPETLIIEAAIEAKKDKNSPHIGNAPRMPR
jgi:hypothetical protein